MKFRIALVGFVSAAALCSALPATANPPKSPAPPQSSVTPAVRVTTPMSITGWDEKVGRAHGYTQVKQNGRVYIVKAQKSQKGKQAPTDRVTSTDPYVVGPCGSSWLYYNAQGGRKALVDTGFYLNDPAVAYSWTVAVTDRLGVGSKKWSGALALTDTWEKYWTTSHGTTGYSWAQVTKGSATLYNGSICTTGHPSDHDTLY